MISSISAAKKNSLAPWAGRSSSSQAALLLTDAAIEPSRVYGSVDDGTARVLYMPAVTHPGDHISRDAIGYAIAWFQQTLKGGTPLPRENQNRLVIAGSMNAAYTADAGRRMSICVRATDKLKAGKAQYNALYNENAGLVDDITISAITDTHWMMVANAGNRDADVAHLRKHAADLISIEPWENYTLIAVQGPKAHEHVAKHFADLDSMYYYEARLPKPKTFIARMGYTGEDGFEIACDTAEGIKLWQTLQAGGVSPCGLASRDVLRLESLMPLYGHELSMDLRPQESGIAFIYNDHECIAPRQAREKPVGEITCGFHMTSEGVPRQGYAIVTADGTMYGWIGGSCAQPTSASRAALKRSIARDRRGILSARRSG